MADCAIGHEISASEPRTEDVALNEVLPFQKMNLNARLKKSLKRCNFQYPTEIQAAAIPLGIAGIDLILKSKAGTGKTLVFCTTILQKYNYKMFEPQALIVVPTRELATQIVIILNELGQNLPEFKVVQIVGGTPVAEDRKRLLGAKVVVGTPGRLMNLIKTNVLNTKQIDILVLDEADKLLDKSFQGHVQFIKNSVEENCQILACSATFDWTLAKKYAPFLKCPLIVSTEKRSTVLMGVKQFVIILPERTTSYLDIKQKLEAIQYVFSILPFEQTVLFASSQSRAETYCNYLTKEGWPCDLLSGGLNAQERKEVFKKFRENNLRILVATDLMSRGIDSRFLNLVINVELPIDLVTYLHRIGRSGRFGGRGISITILSSFADQLQFSKFLKETNGTMVVHKFPSKGKAGPKVDFWDFRNKFPIFDPVYKPKKNADASLPTAPANSEETDQQCETESEICFNAEDAREDFDRKTKKHILTERLNDQNIIVGEVKQAKDGKNLNKNARQKHVPIRPLETHIYDLSYAKNEQNNVESPENAKENVQRNLKEVKATKQTANDENDENLQEAKTKVYYLSYCEREIEIREHEVEIREEFLQPPSEHLKNTSENLSVATSTEYLPLSSNTIDDASSLVADSFITTQVFYQDKVSATNIELKSADNIFDDYETFLMGSEGEDGDEEDEETKTNTLDTTKQTPEMPKNIKTLLIDNENEETEVNNIKGKNLNEEFDPFKDYEEFEVADTCNEDINANAVNSNTYTINNGQNHKQKFNRTKKTPQKAQPIDASVLKDRLDQIKTGPHNDGNKADDFQAEKKETNANPVQHIEIEIISTQVSMLPEGKDSVSPVAKPMMGDISQGKRNSESPTVNRSPEEKKLPAKIPVAKISPAATNMAMAGKGTNGANAKNPNRFSSGNKGNYNNRKQGGFANRGFTPDTCAERAALKREDARPKSTPPGLMPYYQNILEPTVAEVPIYKPDVGCAELLAALEGKREPLQEMQRSNTNPGREVYHGSRLATARGRGIPRPSPEYQPGPFVGNPHQNQANFYHGHMSRATGPSPNEDYPYTNVYLAGAFKNPGRNGQPRCQYPRSAPSGRGVAPRAYHYNTPVDSGDQASGRSSGRYGMANSFRRTVLPPIEIMPSEEPRSSVSESVFPNSSISGSSRDYCNRGTQNRPYVSEAICQEQRKYQYRRYRRK